MYKKSILSVFLVLSIVLISACSNSSTFKSEISLPLLFSADEETLYFLLDGNSYEVQNKPADWLTLGEELKDNKKHLSFTTDKNESKSERTTIVLVKIGAIDYTFNVKQEASN